MACGATVDPLNFHRAHDIARVHGGLSTVANSYVACSTCNTGSSTQNFSAVIAAMRTATNQPLVAERLDPDMVLSGLRWMREPAEQKRHVKCPWSTLVLPTELRTWTTPSFDVLCSI